MVSSDLCERSIFNAQKFIFCDPSIFYDHNSTHKRNIYFEIFMNTLDIFHNSYWTNSVVPLMIYLAFQFSSSFNFTKMMNVENHHLKWILKTFTIMPLFERKNHDFPEHSLKYSFTNFSVILILAFTEFIPFDFGVSLF